MNFKNITENLVITISVMIVTAFITYKATLNSALKTNEITNNALIPAIIEGIKKETNSINNNTSNSVDIKKLKARKNDSLNINFRNQQPSDSNLQLNASYKEGDVINDLILIKIDDLTRKQRKRLLNIKKK